MSNSFRRLHLISLSTTLLVLTLIVTGATVERQPLRLRVSGSNVASTAALDRPILLRGFNFWSVLPRLLAPLFTMLQIIDVLHFKCQIAVGSRIWTECEL